MSKPSLKFASLITSMIILTVSPAAFRVQRAEVSGIIYIRADGSIDPMTAPICTSGNFTYTFTGNIYGSIVIERNNTLIDGSNYTVQGRDPIDSDGINLTRISNVTISNMNIAGFYSAMSLYSSSNISLHGNCMANNSYGVYLSNCSDISISANSMTQNSNYDIMLYNSSHSDISNNKAKSPNEACIFLDYSSCNGVSNNDLTSYGVSIRLWFSSDNNTVIENNLRGYAYGIECESASSNNSIYNNNFIGNASHVYTSSCINVWNNGYPAGGNYWGNHTGSDMKSGPHQNETGSDAISDNPYVIDANNTDLYPLIGTFSDFNASGQHVQTICNSTITDFQFNGTAIRLSVCGQNGTFGFCRICIPAGLIADNYTVLIDGAEVNSTLLPCSNSNNSYLYFNYKLTLNKLKDRADLNKDGVINILDTIILSRAWNSTPGSPEWIAEADLNEDGVINLLDIVLLSSMIGETTNIATHEVTIIPELSLLILPMFMIATMLAAIVYKRKRSPDDELAITKPIA